MKAITSGAAGSMMWSPATPGRLVSDPHAHVADVGKRKAHYQ
jgi:hypothetical protein